MATIRIDPSKVNLLEKDIEEYLWKNPHSITYRTLLGDTVFVEKWLGRQIKVPSGIIDLFGVTNAGKPILVEVKNVQIDAKAFAQVSRYAKDIRNTIGRRYGYDFSESGLPARVVVGNSIDGQALHEAEALGIIPLVFSVSMHLQLDRHVWREPYLEQLNAEITELAQDDDLFGEFDSFFYREQNSAEETTRKDSEETPENSLGISEENLEQINAELQELGVINE